MTTHTKSTDGRLHRLTHRGFHVQIRYVEAPRFDDQVQGDLIRKYCREIHPIVLGVVNGGVATVDASLDEIQNPPLTGRQVAEAATKAAPWDWDVYAPNRDQIEDLIAYAVEADRKTR